MTEHTARSRCPTPATRLPARVRIGTAGWRIPNDANGNFLPGSSRLERYASRFDAVEINSSFYRSHRNSTYQRWATAVPDTFRFAVKLPKEITHVHRLRDVVQQLDEFVAGISGLGDKLGVLLLQLPPSLQFNPAAAEKFLRDLRERTLIPVACEPRHASWFSPEVDAILASFQIGRVRSDPKVVPAASPDGGWPGLVYCRLHGSPRVYYSPYSHQAISAVIEQLVFDAARNAECWCVFDNTALGAAASNALTAVHQMAEIAQEGDGRYEST